jgi:hypothetical protein
MALYALAKNFNPEDGGRITSRNVSNAAHFHMSRKPKNKVNIDNDQVISCILELVTGTDVALMGDMPKAFNLFSSL